MLVVVMLFGAKRLPELGKSLGSGLREFKGTIAPDSHTAPASALPEAAAAPADHA